VGELGETALVAPGEQGTDRGQSVLRHAPQPGPLGQIENGLLRCGDERQAEVGPDEDRVERVHVSGHERDRGPVVCSPDRAVLARRGDDRPADRAPFGPVHWLSVAVLGPATLVGGYVGAHVARRLAAVLLWSIVTFAVGVGVVLLLRAF
jgi:hypothetical protein